MSFSEIRFKQNITILTAFWKLQGQFGLANALSI